MSMESGEARTFSLDGGDEVGGSNEKVVAFLMQAMRMNPEVVDQGQLANYVGNTLAGLIGGDDSISILDLPH